MMCTTPSSAPTKNRRPAAAAGVRSVSTVGAVDARRRLPSTSDGRSWLVATAHTAWSALVRANASNWHQGSPRRELTVATWCWGEPELRHRKPFLV